MRIRRTRAVLSALFASIPAWTVLSCGNGSHGLQAATIEVDPSITSRQCVVTIGTTVAAAVEIGDITLDYSNADGSFGGPQYGARCRSMIHDATRSVAFNRCDTDCSDGEHRELYLTMSMGEPGDDLHLDAPADLFECFFEGDGTTLANLSGGIHLSTPTLNPVPDADLAVRVVCDGWPDSTTTTTTTTSTLPCDGSSCGNGDILPLTFQLDDDVKLGALQLRVSFASEVGAFDQYSTPSIKCTLAEGVGALFATNQSPRIDDPGCVDCVRQLNVAFAFGAVGFTGAGPIMSCDFVVGDRMPQTEDFEIEIVDVSTPAGVPIVPPPTVSLQGFPGQ